MSSRGILLSSLKRDSYLRWMADRKLDVLVIGGGITGAGIALDAASRGLTVGLVEKQDFAEGTSSRSTKLIHGGLRYLKQLEIGIVREVGRERTILHQNAPHLVTPELMLLPIIEGGTYGKLATSVGLWVYDKLAGVKRTERRRMLTREQTIDTEPLLSRSKLRGGGLYYEYRTDDARLTIEVMKTAAAYGARCVNYVEATQFTYDGKHKMTGAVVHDIMSGTEYTIQASKVINATGPWVDQIRERDGSRKGKRLHLTKGVHIVVSRERAPIAQSVYFDVPDGRMIFAIPRDGTTYIGTTDTDYQGEIEQPTVTKGDVTYLLAAFNAMFPTTKLTEDDVQSSWVGLRPLIHEDGKSLSELSRKDEIFVSESGLISIAGGKLTGYRKMAERVVDLAMKELAQEQGKEFIRCYTDRIQLSGGAMLSEADINVMRMSLSEEFSNEIMNDLQIQNLLFNLMDKYGSNTPAVVSEIIRCKSSGVVEKDAPIIGEFNYCVQHEMTTRPSDFLIRRTGRLLFERAAVEQVGNVIRSYSEPKLIRAFEVDKDAWDNAYISTTTFYVQTAAAEG